MKKARIREITNKIVTPVCGGIGCLCIFFLCMGQFMKGVLIIFGEPLKTLRSETTFTDNYMACYLLSTLFIFASFLGLYEGLKVRNKKEIFVSILIGAIAISALISSKFLLKGAVI